MTNALTPYDRGVRAEPQVWPHATRKDLETLPPLALEMEEDRFGRVDFNDDENATLLNARVEREADGRVFLYVDLVSIDDVAVIVRA
ncbi:hypothetical protein SEA_RUDY_74 [Microbacterium phage Rudy]|uniref:Uncharacterized protein n=1 Tax=Microbacterium phage Judebell TaxID=3230835 RepID=A0AAU8EHS0_9CAUD|nr:hypothetical protein SEA_CASEND_77 [Microbacterium phage Casend]QQO39256.1 hypothetical protein SEA_RUDY_74 [Microbacterium phage Rudy]QQO39585.1 hypothetical protein SEA_PHABIA_76 [Microbacterium phage Phabia]QWY80460.1 hypothetical protein SEA_TEEHEE_77 [Microbacterium phage Teehee]QWY80561.1 hypothetical protein SEA_QUAMMI_75 [Microbacterium phage Quammi]QXN73471.1 hypothetical protein SEA_JEHOSHAPHAT_78 [Microbacterium phage Jehoshaphat]UVG33920.1 hypothetical protein SEA_VICEROY_75 [M